MLNPNGSPPRRRMFLGTLVLATLIVPVSATGSARADAEFGVSARVLPRTTLRVLSAPLDLVVSARDVRQAYVDVGQPTRVEVFNNNPQGYMLLVTSKMPGVTALIVREAGVQVTLVGEGGAIPERGVVGAHMPISLAYRFVLGPQMEPGRYPWPVQLRVQPLPP